MKSVFDALTRSSRLISVTKCFNMSMKDSIKEIFYAAVEAVKPSELITKNRFIKFYKVNSCEIVEIGHGKSSRKFDVTNKTIHLVGFGKGVLGITAELKGVLAEKLSAGILSVPIGASASFKELKSIKVIEGAEGNLPDMKAMKAAEEIRDKVLSLNENDILIAVITGGGSALLPLPIEPITLEEKSLLVKQLSRAGASINELNIVRIAVSQVKGGKLAEMGKNAHKIISIIVSDIINDPLNLIASGPTIPFTKPDISPKDILEKYNLLSSLPKSIADVIQTNRVIEDATKTIKNANDVFLIGNNRIAIDAAIVKTKEFQLIPVLLSTEVEGNVIDVSQAFFELAVAILNFPSSSEDGFVEKIGPISEILSAQPNFINELVAALKAKDSKGICIISGGETLVTVTGDGLGGRNQEMALRFSKLCLDANTSSLDDLLLLSAGTDGVDGNNDAAGSLGGSRILSKFIENVDASDVSRIMQDCINKNDSYRFYKNILKPHAGDGYQITIGHTGTNVMDVHLLMIMRRAEEKRPEID